jgi:hypothetical protein
MSLTIGSFTDDILLQVADFTAMWNVQWNVVGATAVVIAAILLYAYYMPSRHHPKEERKMSSKTREARREYVKSRVSDAIVAALEDAIYKRELTNDEVKWWYRKFGTSCELKDLLPKGPYVITFPSAAKLKIAISERMKLNGKAPSAVLAEKKENTRQQATMMDLLRSKRM